MTFVRYEILRMDRREQVLMLAVLVFVLAIVLSAIAYSSVIVAIFVVPIILLAVVGGYVIFRSERTELTVDDEGLTIIRYGTPPIDSTTSHEDRGFLNDISALFGNRLLGTGGEMDSIMFTDISELKGDDNSCQIVLKNGQVFVLDNFYSGNGGPYLHLKRRWDAVQERVFVRAKEGC